MVFKTKSASKTKHDDFFHMMEIVLENRVKIRTSNFIIQKEFLQQNPVTGITDHTLLPQYLMHKSKMFLQA